MNVPWPSGRAGRTVVVLVAVAVVASLALAFWPREREGTDLVLDGRPRFPDDQGIVTKIDADGLELDGARTYAFSPNLVSFSTYTMEIEPVRSRLGQYVQIGADDDVVEWVAGFARVFPGTPPLVYYTGSLVNRVGRDLIFADGSVLRLERDFDLRHVEGLRGAVIVRIDAKRHVVETVTPA